MKHCISLVFWMALLVDVRSSLGTYLRALHLRAGVLVYKVLHMAQT